MNEEMEVDKDREMENVNMKYWFDVTYYIFFLNFY
jgi:hypothetical protein